MSGIDDPDWADEKAAELVDAIQQQNWKNGGVLTLDRLDAIEFLAAHLRLIQKGGEIIGMDRLVKALGVPSPPQER